MACTGCGYTLSAKICLDCVDKVMGEQRMLGVKAGLEVAKDIMKREGYDFQFPDPESIKIEKDDNGKN